MCEISILCTTFQNYFWKPTVCISVCLCVQSCLTLWDPMDCSLPGSSVHGISQARILEWVAISSSRESFWPKHWTHISCVSCIAGGFFTAEPSGKECISHEHLKISYVFTTEYMQFYFFCFQLLFLSTAIFWIMEGLLFLFSHFTITLRNQMHRMCTVLSHSVVSDSLRPHGL